MKRVSGWAAIELTVLATVASVVGAAIYVEATEHLESAERMRMETQARLIGNALQIRIAPLIAQRREREIVELVRINPVEWLPAPPENYLGERVRSPERGEAMGTWYFDGARGELVYRVRRGSRFVPDAAGERQIRFRTEIVREEGAAEWKVVGALFRPVETYQWR